MNKLFKLFLTILVSFTLIFSACAERENTEDEDSSDENSESRSDDSDDSDNSDDSDDSKSSSEPREPRDGYAVAEVKSVAFEYPESWTLLEDKEDLDAFFNNPEVCKQYSMSKLQKAT